MSKNRQVTIEGYTADELLGLLQENVDSLILCGNPIAFRVGTAEILGQFKIEDQTLVVELAHIDGGGEGVLPTLWALVERYAKTKHLPAVKWIVHAVHCAKPNLKLRRLLELKGFTIQRISGGAEAYTCTTKIRGSYTDILSLFGKIDYNEEYDHKLARKGKRE
jgi:hypothetical protein